MSNYYTWYLKQIRSKFLYSFIFPIKDMFQKHDFYTLSLKDRLKNRFNSFVFKYKYGISGNDIWNPNDAIAKYTLKTLWFMQNPKGYPCSLITSETGNDFELHSQQWQKIIHDIRFAFFYFLFIYNDLLSDKITTPEEKNYCRRWAQRKYWYVRDFLTKEFFDERYLDYIFDYEIKTEQNPSKNQNGIDEIKIKMVHKKTGEELSYEKTKELLLPEEHMVEKYHKDFETGLEYFKKYFIDLWL